MSEKKVYPKSVFASLPRTVRGAPIVLGGDPKGKNFLYTNRNSVIIRDINNPAIADVYTQHSQPCLVAKYAPSGFYIASADASGKVRIWDTTNREHILKNEYHVFSGPIKDLAWSPDSKRIIVGGQGLDKFCHVFLCDTGSRLGTMCGHTKAINSVDYRPNRPYRVVMASEDYHVSWCAGPPFDDMKFCPKHANFVNVVRYDPKGTVFVSGGADGKICIYEGTNGDLLGTYNDQSAAHKAGVYAVCFNNDGSQLLSVSADKTAKIWDCSTTQLVTEFKMGDTVNDMQVGCLWQNEHILTVSLSGYINYLDKNNPDKPLRILKGHNNMITALAANSDGSKFYTGSTDSNICQWDYNTGEAEIFVGKGHDNQVQDIAVADDEIASISVDDTIRFTPLASLTYGADKLKLNGQPKAVASSGHITVVACVNEVVVLEHKKKVCSLPAKGYEPTSIDVNKSATHVAVGGDNNNVCVYSLSGNNLSIVTELSHTNTVVDVKFSPDEKYLAAVDTDRKLVVYDTSSWTKTSNRSGVSHAARVNSVDWSPDSSRLCVGSLDTGISVWLPENLKETVHIKAAHALSNVLRVCWLNNTTVVTAGADCNLNVWQFDN